jgi:hypothetical protein
MFEPPGSIVSIYLTPISTMNLVDLFYNYSLWFALLAIVLIIVGLVVLASGNSVGWVPLLCGLVIGGALWGIVRKHANPTPNQTSQELNEIDMIWKDEMMNEGFNG